MHPLKKMTLFKVRLTYHHCKHSILVSIGWIKNLAQAGTVLCSQVWISSQTTHTLNDNVHSFLQFLKKNAVIGPPARSWPLSSTSAKNNSLIIILANNYYLLKCNVMQSCRSVLNFQIYCLPFQCQFVIYLVGLVLQPNGKGSMFLWYSYKLLPPSKKTVFFSHCHENLRSHILLSATRESNADSTIKQTYRRKQNFHMLSLNTLSSELISQRMISEKSSPGIN
jgi:hypothetical protein